MNVSRISLCLALFAAGAMLSSCSHGRIHYEHTQSVAPPKSAKHGPPPHAPAHGYRHKNPDGVVITYQKQIHAYVVVGHANHYYYKGRYYRRSGSTWQVSVKFGGPWKPTSVLDVPKNLKKIKSRDTQTARSR